MIENDWTNEIERLRAENKELLEACKTVVEHDNSGGIYLSFDEVCEICRAAILKSKRGK